jgi:CDP-diglyceride synthetase
MKNLKPFFPILFFFIVTTGAVLALENLLQKNEVDPVVLLAGNTVIFIATMLSFLIYYRSLKKAASTGVLKGLYMSFIVKFFLCLLAAFSYIMIEKKNINKPALFISMGLYIFYTIIEVATLQRIMRSPKKSKPAV